MRLERRMIYFNTLLLAALGAVLALKGAPLSVPLPVTLREGLANERLLGAMLGGAGLALWFLRRLAQPADSRRITVGWLLVNFYSALFIPVAMNELLGLQPHSRQAGMAVLWIAALVHITLLTICCAALFWRKGSELQRIFKVLLPAEATLATIVGFGSVMAARPLSTLWSSSFMIRLVGMELVGIALVLMLLGNPADGRDRRRLLLGLGAGNVLTLAAALFGLKAWGFDSAWGWMLLPVVAALAAGSFWAGVRAEKAHLQPTLRQLASRLTWSHLLAGLVAAIIVLAAPSLSIPAWIAVILAIGLSSTLSALLVGDLQTILLNPAALFAAGQVFVLPGSKLDEEARQTWMRQVSEAAAQEERNRLARDLHDSIKQQLFSINVGTATAQERWERDPDGARKALADVRRSAREALVEMQAMLHQLRPEALGTAGLIEALREQCEALGYRTGAEVTLELGDPIPDENLPPGAQETLFRIAQEMLANVARHARAQKVRLWLGRQGEEVVIRIVDDGQGFDPAAQGSGMGMRNLSERAASLHGALEVASAPGAGAALTIRIPLVAPPPPVVAEGKRIVLSNFLSISFQACFALAILTKSAIPRTPDGGVGCGFMLGEVLVLILLSLFAWRLGRSRPRSVRSYANRTSELLLSLVVGWMWIGLGREIKDLSETPWLWAAVPLVAFLYATIDWIWIHRASEARPSWWEGALSPLWLIVPVEMVILVTLGSFLFRPGPLALNPMEAAQAFFLLALAVAFPYVASRQRRAEGAAQ